MNPVIAELLKIFGVTIGWIGSLIIFMWIKEKNKKKDQPSENIQISRAA